MNNAELLNLIDNDFLNQVYRYCYRRTAYSIEAEELCSDILFAIVKTCNRKKEIPVENPHAYFFAIARRVYADFSEKKRISGEKTCKGDPEEILALVTDSAEDPDTEAEDRQRVAAIFRQISFLSKAYREVMIGYYLDGKTIKTLAQELNISENAVRQRLFSARNTIQKEVTTMKEKTPVTEKPTALQTIDYTIWGTGNPGDGDPRDLLCRQLSKHTVWLCRNKPMTARAISEELHVPMPYIEEELEIQVNGTNGRYGTLQKDKNGAYVPSFVLLDCDEIKEIQQIYIDYIPMICDAVARHIETCKEDYLAFPYINKTPTLNLILWQQVSVLAGRCSDSVARQLKEHYFHDVTPSSRPFTIFGYRTPENAKNWGGGWDGVEAHDICGYKKIRIDNIYIGRIKKHFSCGLNVARDAKMRLAIRAVKGLPVKELDETEQEIAAKAIQCGYLYRDGDTLYTKFLVCEKKDCERLFLTSDRLKSEFTEASDQIAAKLSEFIRKHIPQHLLGDFSYVNALAAQPVLDSLVESLIDRGILIPPENGVGAEGIWMSVQEF